MKKSDLKKGQFQAKLIEITGADVRPEQTEQIFEYAFELIQEGLVNAAINCTLTGDMNAINLDSLLNEAEWDNDEAVQMQSMVNKAGNLLANDHDEIEELIKKIQKQPDDFQVDYVDGVNVWQKLEFSLTCKEFLEQIS